MSSTSKPDDISPIPLTRSPRPRRALALIALAAGAAVLAGLLQTAPARAVEFGDGGIQGSVDTTISQGMTFRVGKRDRTLAGKTNSNDGNLNYGRGIVANTSKFTTDFDLRADRFGLFVRAAGFVDHENRDGKGDRTELSGAAKERVGSDLGLLDAYVTAPFEVGDAAIDLRLGKHVLNWGESTFIPNGIAAINPFDVSKLRLPGSELREALLPVWMASAEVAPTDTLSVAGFYQFVWEETHIDPVGSYFSTTDYAGPGAMRAVVEDSRISIPGIDLGDTGLIEGGNPFAAFGVGADPYFMNVSRGRDRTPDDSGQWGLAVRFLAEKLNNTEFGFYFINYHSRLPTISARTGTVQGAGAGLQAAGAVQAAAPTNHPLTPATQAIATQAGIDAYAKSASYSLEYPEDIQLFGLSFNTALGTSGWALQGEYSLRRNAPLQIAERTVLGTGLAPFLACLAQGAQAAACVGQNAPGTVGFGANIQGYVEREVSQVQATATRVFGPMIGADALVFVTEAALMHVHDMPDKNTMPLESPAGGTRSTAGADADATSWGYRMAARLDYNNAVGGANLYPYAQFLHDVSGNSPAPSGPFIAGRTALTLGLRADYLSRWQADLSYTRMAGDGYDLSDRDFVSLSVKYSF